MQKSTRTHAPRGQGSVYRVGDRWRGSIYVTDEDGRRVRRFVSAETADAVVERLHRAQADAERAAALAKTPTLAWWAERWLGTVRLRVRAATLRAYRGAMRRDILPRLGGTPLSQLRSGDVEQLLGRLVDAGRAPSSVALVRRILVACLSDAERDGLILRNVARSARPPRVEAIERRRLSPAEARHLLALAAQDPRTDALVALALGTGARVGELCALDWSDVDLDEATITIRGTLGRSGIVGPPKSRRGRRVVALPGFVIASLRRELDRRPGMGPVLADAVGRRLTIERTGERWRDLRDRSGIGSDMRFHDLRGSAATLALAAGVTPTEVARSLGHDPAVLMRTYAGAIPGGRGLVADGIERALR